MPVERQWVDLDSRVFYPLKRCLIQLEENGEIDIEHPVQKNAVSVVSCMLVEIGVQRYITSHNHQRVQGN